MSNFDFTKTLLNGNKQYIDAVIDRVAANKDHAHSWNDLTDRPFGEEIVEAPIVIEWDGDITDKIKLLEGQEHGICYISDKVVNDSQELIGKKVQYYYDDTLYNITLDESMYSTELYMDDIKGYQFRFKHGIDPATVFYNITVMTTRGEFYGTQYENGIYLSFDHNYGNDYVASLEIGTGTQKVVKTLDQKYLPEHLQFGETQTTILVDNLTSEELSNGNVPECNFISGQEYTVIWNGVEYSNLECYKDGDYNVIASSDNGCPFYIDDDGGGSLYIESDTEDESFTVSIITEEVIQLDRKYIAEHLASLPVYPGKKVEGQTFTIDGEEIVAEYGAEVFNFYGNIATGNSSHAEGSSTIASNIASHAEGYETIASGIASHAEGYCTTASGQNSHAEGNRTTASGQASHAEGDNTTASGIASHAEGQYTTASGQASHAEGIGTKASSSNQHVQGVCNIEDTEQKYAHIVGNGEFNISGNTYSNAHTLDWSGNAWYQGGVYVGGTSQTDATPLTTVQMITWGADD